MSVQNTQVLVPPLRGIPPAAYWIADLAGWLFSASDAAGSRLVARLDAQRVRRGVERELRREARSRAQLVALAHRYEATQPEFAKDLYAASCRDGGEPSGA